MIVLLDIWEAFTNMLQLFSLQIQVNSFLQIFFEILLALIQFHFLFVSFGANIAKWLLFFLPIGHFDHYSINLLVSTMTNQNRLYSNTALQSCRMQSRQKTDVEQTIDALCYWYLYQSWSWYWYKYQYLHCTWYS